MSPFRVLFGIVCVVGLVVIVFNAGMDAGRKEANYACQFRL